MGNPNRDKPVTTTRCAKAGRHKPGGHNKGKNRLAKQLAEFMGRGPAPVINTGATWRQDLMAIKHVLTRGTTTQNALDSYLAL